MPSFIKVKNISPPFVIIFVLGLILLTISLLFSKTLAFFWSNFLQVIGVAFIAVSLTSPISDYFQFKTLSEYMGLLRGARDSGVIHIFKSRKAERISFQEAVEREFAEADKVFMAGVAFPRILHDSPLPQLIDEKMFNPNVPIKILLMDPDGVAAKERSEIEIGRGTIFDIQRCKENLGLIIKERAKLVGSNSENDPKEFAKKVNLEIHLYDFPPTVFMIATENCLFLEQYHFGRLPTERPGECIGGITPVVQYSADSATYQIMECHFNYIWDKKSRDITFDLFKEVLSL